MPVVQISLVEGRDAGRKRALVSAVTEAVVETLGVTPQQVRVLLYELPLGHWGVGGVVKEDEGK